MFGPSRVLVLGPDSSLGPIIAATILPLLVAGGDPRLLPGLVIYPFDAPLFFANVKSFRDEITAVARREPAPRWIVVAAEPITDIDTTAADVLLELDRLLDGRGQALVFAELKDPVRRKIERYGLAQEMESRHSFPTVEAAVDAFRAKTGAAWTDGQGVSRVPDARPSPERATRHPS